MPDLKKQSIKLAGKKVTVMGLGLYEEGSGISATKFLLSQGAKVTVTDLKTEEDLREQINRLGKSAEKVNFVLGQHREEDFVSADLIVKNPAIPRYSKYLEIARKNNIPIETDISLFFKLVDRKKIIAITGTRGKSTTTTLIYDILRQAGKQVILGGNITKSPLMQLTKMKGNGLAVLELSSWLLESLEDAQLSPHLAVFTNIYPDHLNTYKDIDDYASAKENIFRWQDKNDLVVLNLDNNYTKAMGKRVPARRFWFSCSEFKEENGAYLRGQNIYFRLNGGEKKILNLSDIKIPGEHNVANVLAAVCACAAYGVSAQAIKRAVRDFGGVPNRLELLREIKGVKYYNDTTSTTPEAGMAALQALGKNKNIVLIAGGADKGLNFLPWVKEIKKHCKALVLLTGTGTDRIEKEISGIKNYVKAASMADAVGLAKSFADLGDIVLLSPACASFGLFKNEFDRGDQFRGVVGKMK